MFQKVNFDTQEFRFIPLLSSLPFLRIYIYSPNERDGISIQIFSIPSSHRRYIQAFNLAKWLFDTAVSIDSNRFRNLRQFIRGFFAFSTNFPVPFQSARTRFRASVVYLLLFWQRNGVAYDRII